MKINFSTIYIMSRAIYDKGVYIVNTKESKQPLDYMFLIDYNENCLPCNGKPGVSKHEERVEIESDILGHIRKETRDPKTKFQKGEKTKNINYMAPWVCERQHILTNPNFLDNSLPGNWMEKLKESPTPNFLDNRFPDNWAEKFQESHEDKMSRSKK